MKTRRDRSVPRVTIYPDGRVTMSGLHYSDLRSILTQAALHNYEALKTAERGSEDYQYHEDRLRLLDAAKTAMDGAISATHRPVKGPRTGQRYPATLSPQDVPVQERWRSVRQEQTIRRLVAQAFAARCAEANQQEVTA